MSSIQQQLAELAKWHRDEADLFVRSALTQEVIDIHKNAAALLDKLANAETLRMSDWARNSDGWVQVDDGDEPCDHLKYATALLIPEEA